MQSFFSLKYKPEYNVEKINWELEAIKGDQTSLPSVSSLKIQEAIEKPLAFQSTKKKYTPAHFK